MAKSTGSPHLPDSRNPYGLTIKQRRFVAGLLEGKSSIDAYRAAGYKVGENRSMTSVGVDAYRAKQSPTVQREITRVLESKGLTDEKIASHIEDIISTSKYEKRSQANVVKLLEMVLRLKDRFPAEKRQIDKRVLTAQLRMRPLEELEEQLQRMRVETTQIIEESKKTT